MGQTIIAVVAAFISLASVVVTVFARHDSKASAEAARDSADAAKQSLWLSQREEARAIERRDVRWELVERGKRDGGLVEYRNVGTTTAHAVTAVLIINGARVPLDDLGDIEAGAIFTHDATETFARALAEERDKIRAMNNTGWVYASSGPKFEVAARITWESAQGVPDVQEG